MMTRAAATNGSGATDALRASVIERLAGCLRDLDALGENLAAIDVNQALLKLGDENE